MWGNGNKRESRLFNGIGEIENPIIAGSIAYELRQYLLEYVKISLSHNIDQFLIVVEVIRIITSSKCSNRFFSVGNYYIA